MTVSSDLQKSVVAALKASTALVTQLGGRIYGDPPQDPSYPFVRFGRYDIESDDTSGTLGSILSFTLEVHDRPKSGGRVEVLKAADRIVDVLHNNESALSIPNYTVWGVFLDNSQLTKDRDGLSYIFMLLFEAKVQKNG